MRLSLSREGNERILAISQQRKNNFKKNVFKVCQTIASYAIYFLIYFYVGPQMQQIAVY